HGRALHVVNPRWNPFDAVVDRIEQEGYGVERLGYDDWLRALEEHVRRDRGHPLAMLVPVLKRLDPTVDPSISKVLPIEHAQVDALLGEDALGAIGDVGALLRVYFDHFYSTGFLARAGQPVAA